jgi:hypothetical protein
MTAKTGFCTKVLLITGLVAIVASAQTIQSVAKFPAEPVLEKVVLKQVRGQFQPAYFIYSDQVVSLADGKRLRFNVLNTYVNRSHTRFVLIKAPHSAIKSRPAEQKVDWTKMPIYFLPDQWDFAGYCRVTGLKLNFFNPQRQLVREYLIPQPVHYINLPSLGAFDNRGKHFVLYKPLTQLDKRKGVPNLFYFLGSGTCLWQTQLPIEKVRAIGVANQAQLIIVSGQLFQDSIVSDAKTTLILDSTAQIIASFPLVFDNYNFSQDDSYLALADNYSIWLIHLPRKAPRFINTICADNRVITDCRFFGDYLLVATGLKGYWHDRLIYNDPTLLLFDLEGHKVADLTFPLDYSVEGKLIVDGDSHQFGFIFQDRLEVFHFSAPTPE